MFFAETCVMNTGINTAYSRSPNLWLLSKVTRRTFLRITFTSVAEILFDNKVNIRSRCECVYLDCGVNII